MDRVDGNIESERIEAEQPYRQAQPSFYVPESPRCMNFLTGDDSGRVNSCAAYLAADFTMAWILSSTGRGVLTTSRTMASM